MEIDIVEDNMQSMLLLDIFSCFAVTSVIFGIEMLGYPFKRGYFCNDETIMYPYKVNTLTRRFIYTASIVIPTLVITLNEMAIFYQVSTGLTKVAHFFLRIYKTVVVFIFSILCLIVVVDVTKYSTGRLAPNFFMVCRPQILCNRGNSHKYITKYHCQGGENAEAVKQARLSFPSGHSAVATFSMVYLVMYIEERFVFKSSLYLRRTLQFFCLLLVLFVCYSRHLDHARHPSDIVIGIGLGMAGAYLTAYFLSKFNSAPISSKTETNAWSTDFNVQCVRTDFITFSLNMMKEGDVNGKFGLPLVVDFVCLLVLLGAIFGLHFYTKPVQNGFFCEDLSIRYPYKEDTVPRGLLYFLCLFIPLAILTGVETVRHINEVKPGRRNLSSWFNSVYSTVGSFIFGFFCLLLVVNFMKVMTGELSPSFFDVCNPNVDCSLIKRKYIHAFRCNSMKDMKRLRESRLSFPSGHSAVAAFSMYYLVVYVQARLIWRPAHFFKPLIQVCLILIALSVGFSRISDNARHWFDVCAGLGLGAFGGHLIAVQLSCYFAPINEDDEELFDEEFETPYKTPSTSLKH
ncbi:putative phosphatidate phosphatase [Cimex lectularius]|uniref:Phosphatidic acid phosphatase type 2/haloperoxidase domain-containing protein n=1 Tax=Cimex lectularius TaxID=79782 RepID=A0A8I6RVZ0_CIMLE|nr:putative phosphatidate phosphatase [Cimex lectularius]